MDAEATKFYQILRKHFADLFRQATESQLVICIPPDESVEEYKQNILQFIKSHILKQSPCFLGEYNSLTGNTIIEDDVENILRVNHYRIQAKIVKREKCYNEDLNPYKIWFVDHPLVPMKRQGKLSSWLWGSSTPQNPKSSLPPPHSIDETNAYLKVLDPQAFRYLEQVAERFNTSAILVQGFEKNTVSKLEHIIEEATQTFVDQLNRTQTDLINLDSSNDAQALEVAIHT